MSVTNQKTFGNKGTNSPYQLALVEITKDEYNRLTATGGSEYSDSKITGRFKDRIYAFVVQGDTQITSITAGKTPDSLSTFLVKLGISGKTLKQGALFALETDYFIDSMDISTGAVIFYKLKNG